MLKTCGTTTLLNVVEPLLAVARGCGLGEVENVFYSRKCFIEPARQIQPHGHFKSEAAVLARTFCALACSSHVFGPLSGDHWYLFMAGDVTVPLGRRPRSLAAVAPDQTLEVDAGARVEPPLTRWPIAHRS